MRILPYCCAALLLAACNRNDAASGDSIGATTAAVTPAATTSPEQAAAIANAIAVNPAGADSILKANNHTPESFDQLMYRIAADSAMSATYASAKTP
jgi:hypothetical protein